MIPPRKTSGLSGKTTCLAPCVSARVDFGVCADAAVHRLLRARCPVLRSRIKATHNLDPRGWGWAGGSGSSSRSGLARAKKRRYGRLITDSLVRPGWGGMPQPKQAARRWLFVQRRQRVGIRRGRGAGCGLQIRRCRNALPDPKTANPVSGAAVTGILACWISAAPATESARARGARGCEFRCAGH